MGAYDAYNAWKLVAPSTPKDYFKGLYQETLKQSFDNASDVYDVVHINSINNVQTNLTVRIGSLYRVKSRIYEITDDYKRIFFSDINYVVNLGDLFNFANYYWIVVDTGSIYSISNSVVVRRCNNTIKYYDENHILQSIPCVATNRLEALEEDKIIVLPKDKLKLILPYTTITKNIKLNNYSTTNPYPMRFLLNNLPWKIESIDPISNVKMGIGYIEIMLQSDQKNPNDDLINQIAYNGYIPNITISILNGSSISLALNQTIQLNIKITDNGSVINPTSGITYTTSNINVATVSSTGVVTGVSVGTCVVTVSYNGVSASINVNVVSVLQNNYVVTISGSSSIKVTQSSSYSCIFTNNGITYNDTSIWWLTADDGISSTNLASIVSQDSVNNTCVVKANSNNLYGYVRLYVKNTAGTIQNYIRVQIKSLLG